MPTRVSRRSFLVGGAAGLAGTALGLAAAGCSSSGTSSSGLTSGADPGVDVVALIDPDRVLMAGRPQRIPFAVIDRGTLALPAGATLAVTVRSGDQVIDHLTVAGRLATPAAGNPAADAPATDLLRYFPLRAQLPTPGVYDLDVDLGRGLVRTMAVQAFDPAEVTVAGPGQPFPAIATPTTADPAGTDPICSLAPPCPLHGRSAAEVLAAGQPLALLASAPARCDTAYCGAVLQALVVEAPASPTVAAVHLEFYANERAALAGGGDGPSLAPAPGVTRLGLGFQPSLYVVDRNGIIAERLDGVFDRDEIRAALTAVA